MITDADIKKMQEVFATKEDLAQMQSVFATKEDLTKMQEVFATKGELGEVKSELKSEIAELRVDMNAKFEAVDRRFDEMHDTIDTMAAGIARIENSIDRFTGAIHTLQTENGAGAVHLARHDRQIEALALATHVTLPD